MTQSVAGPLFAVLGFFTLFANTVMASPLDLVGDWAGWAYFDGGRGDTPLRLRIEYESGAYAVRFDELVRREYDLPGAILKWEEPQIAIERKRPNGETIRLQGELKGDSITGTLDWVGISGRFELGRSAERISRMRPEAFADLVGSYHLAEDRTLLISSRSWGELLYSDLGSGRQGTLFPADRDTFFVGPAMYVASPVEARVIFHRDSHGSVTALEWTPVAGGALGGRKNEVIEEDIRFGDGPRVLAGSLLHPAGSTPLPAAVILGGSDWTDRSTVRRDADILASFGLAVLIFDRRGHGRSAGSAIHSFEDDAKDALAAVHFLQGRSDILHDQIGLTGRSQGGWIAPLAAAQSPEVRFLVLFVPPAVSPLEQERTRRLNKLADLGFNKAAQEQESAYLDLAVRYAETRSNWLQYAEAHQRLKAAGFPGDVLESDSADDADWEWGRLNWRYDPIPVLEKVRCPVIALFGGADRNVVAKQNMSLMREALSRAGNREVRLIEVPGANHGLLSLPRGASSLPLHRQVGIGNQGWPEVSGWLREHLTIPGNGRG